MSYYDKIIVTVSKLHVTEERIPHLFKYTLSYKQCNKNMSSFPFFLNFTYLNTIQRIQMKAFTYSEHYIQMKAFTDSEHYGDKLFKRGMAKSKSMFTGSSLEANMLPYPKKLKLRNIEI